MDRDGPGAEIQWGSLIYLLNFQKRSDTYCVICIPLYPYTLYELVRITTTMIVLVKTVIILTIVIVTSNQWSIIQIDKHNNDTNDNY